MRMRHEEPRTQFKELRIDRSVRKEGVEARTTSALSTLVSTVITSDVQ